MLMIVPALGFFVLFVVVPFSQTVRLSFYSWDGILERTWVGTANYRRLASDGVFRQALWNNCLYWWITLASEVTVGLALAALVTRCRRAKGFFRLALSTPLLIALVASAVLWRQLLARIPFFVAPLLSTFGVRDYASTWLDPTFLVVSVSLVSGWAYCGFYMLLFSAALERIPGELREAARLDGAGEWRIFWRIELPLIRPTAVVAFLLCTTGAFRAFDLFWVMAGPMLEPPSEVAATFVVKEAVTRLERGYSAAIAVTVVALVVTMGYALSRLVARAKETEY
jgi:raffinose/stachyose/melibiose transport system permease protein